MYDTLKQGFTACFGAAPRLIFSAPGRTELGGNHTDHQLGLVLAGAVDADVQAAVSPNGRPEIRLQSEGYPLCVIGLDALEPRAEERESTAALIRGVAAGIAERGRRLTGFDAYVRSNILPGGGLSSSAAFEVLVGTILNHLGACGLSAVDLACIGQRAENVYFGKPCGLLDQMACSVGGVIAVDFADPARPLVEPVDFDFAAAGHALCFVDSGASHADLTADYAAIPQELKTLCRALGREHLRQIPEAEFYARLGEARAAAGDRAVLRAVHIYEENKRVPRQAAALKAGDFAAFLELVAQSGRSSWMYLQNVIPQGSAQNQELAFGLALTEHLLRGRGACRVHGGGFAGAIQAFVPLEDLDTFRAEIERVLGPGSCRALRIRAQGGVLLEECV